MNPVFVFRLGPHSVSVLAADVRATAERPPLSPVPGAPTWLPGLWNWLGQPVAIVDIGVVGGLLRKPTPPDHVIGVQTEYGLLGFAASGVGTARDARIPTRARGLFDLVDAEQNLLYLDLRRACRAIDTAMAEERRR